MMRLGDYGLEIIRVYDPPGYRLRYPNYDDENGWTEGVIADGEETEADPEGELNGIEKLLNFILDHFGVFGSKYDAERLRIVRERQDGTIVWAGTEYHADDDNADDDTEYVLIHADKGREEVEALAEATQRQED